MQQTDVPFSVLGQVVADGNWQVDGEVILTLPEAKELYEGTLPAYLG